MDNSFDLEGREFIELKNLLKVVGICETGGQAKQVISEGEVLVDGELETRKACKIKAGSIVQVGDLIVQINA